MIIKEAAEMYLETILMIKKSRGTVRAIDIANRMGYSKPTVSEQMKKFRENGFITVNEGGEIELTSSGAEVAERTFERHNVIAGIFIDLGVDEETAYTDACRVEHYISDTTFNKMKEHFGKNK